MRFRIYDIFSIFIPGVIVTFLFIFLFFDNYSISDITLIAISFVVGFFINTFASWSEDILNVTWGGRPSKRLLEGKFIWKVKLYEFSRIRDCLVRDASSDKPAPGELWETAYRRALDTNHERIQTFMDNYVLSRSLVFTIFVILIAVNFRYWFTDWIFLTTSLALIIIWYRAKQNSYFFAREVYLAYLSEKDRNIKAKRLNSSEKDMELEM